MHRAFNDTFARTKYLCGKFFNYSSLLALDGKPKTETGSDAAKQRRCVGRMGLFKSCEFSGECRKLWEKKNAHFYGV